VEDSRGCGPESQQQAWPILWDFDSSQHFSNCRGLRLQPGVAWGAGQRVDAITDQHCWDLHEIDDYFTRCLGLCLASNKRYPHTPEFSFSSAMDGLERTKAFGGLRIRLEDVTSPDQYGHIAVSTVNRSQPEKDTMKGQALYSIKTGYMYS
jgi:hypothetical protein